MVQMKGELRKSTLKKYLKLYIPHGSDERKLFSWMKKGVFTLYPTWFR